MSYVSDQITRMEQLYGRPDRLRTIQKMTPRELQVVKKSMVGGRAHDITLYIIRKDDK